MQIKVFQPRVPAQVKKLTLYQLTIYPFNISNFFIEFPKI